MYTVLSMKLNGLFSTILFLTSQYFISLSPSNGCSDLKLLFDLASIGLFKIRRREVCVPRGQNNRRKLFRSTFSNSIGCMIFCISSFYAQKIFLQIFLQIFLRSLGLERTLNGPMTGSILVPSGTFNEQILVKIFGQS